MSRATTIGNGREIRHQSLDPGDNNKDRRLPSTSSDRKSSINSDMIIPENESIAETMPLQHVSYTSSRKTVLVTRRRPELLPRRPQSTNPSAHNDREEVKVTRRSVSRQGSRIQQGSRMHILDKDEENSENILKSEIQNDANMTKLRQMISHSKAVMSTHIEKTKPYRSDRNTRAYHTALQIIESSRKVLISGRPGSGKTHTALDLVQALLEAHEYHDVLVINSPYDLNVLENTSNEVIVLAKDCLGINKQSAYYLRGWRRMSKLIETLKDNKQVYFIFTVDNYILDAATDGELLLQTVLNDCSKIDLECNTFSATTKERISMRTTICKHQLDVPCNIDDIAHHCEIYDNAIVGFPVVCSLAKIGNIEKLFVNPLGRIAEYIRETRDQRFASYMLLVLIVLLDEKFPVEGLGIVEKGILLKVQEIFKPLKCSYADVMDSVDELLTLNLISRDHTQKFLKCSHSFIYMAVLQDMASCSWYEVLDLLPAKAFSMFRFRKLSTDNGIKRPKVNIHFKNMVIYVDFETMEFNTIASKFEKLLETGNTEVFGLVASSYLWTNTDFVDVIQSMYEVHFFFKKDKSKRSLSTYLIQCGHSAVLRKVCQDLPNVATKYQDEIGHIMEEAIKERETDILGSFAHFYFGNGKSIVQAAVGSDNMDIVSMVLNPHGKYRTFIQPAISLACATDNVEAVKYLFKQYGHDFVTTLLRKKGPDERTLIHYAAKGGSIKMIEFLVTIGLNINEQTSQGLTVLHIAVIYGRSSLVRSLCSSHPDMVLITDDNGFTAAHYAAREGRFDILRFLLSQGADGTFKVLGGNTIVHLAATNGHVAILNFLLEIYHDLITVPNDMSFTPIQLSACFGQVDTIDLLLKRGNNPNVQTIDGRTLLHLAAFNGHLELVKYLFTKYPEFLSDVDNDGNTVAHDAAASGKIDVLQYFLKNGMDPYTCNNDRCTLLHEACYYGKLQIVQYLTSEFPRMISIRSRNGFSCCHAAALGGHLEIIQNLINSRADPLALSAEGSTILHEAAFGGKLEMVKYITTNCPDMLMMENDWGFLAIHFAAQEGHIDTLVYLLDITDDMPTTAEGQTLLHIAAYNGRIDVVKFLCGQFEDIITETDKAGALATHYAARGGYNDILEFLVSKGTDPYATTSSGSTVNHLAAFDGKLDTVKYLCTKYPDMLQSLDATGHTIAHYAAGSGNLHLLLFCIEHGIDPMSRTSNGSTLLLKAAFGGKLNIVKFLASQYSDMLPIADEFGCNSLHYAVCGGHVDVLQYLCSLNLDPMMKTNDGHTLLHIAAYHGQFGVVDFLCKEYPDLRYVTDSAGLAPDKYAQMGEQTDVLKYLKRSKRQNGITDILSDRITTCWEECSSCSWSNVWDRCMNALCFCRR